MGMMSELDIARQNAEFKVPDDDDLNESFDKDFRTVTKTRERMGILCWYFSQEGHLRIQPKIGYDDSPEAYSSPYVDLPAPFAQKLRALLFD
jgi:hypothetical protein